MNKNNIRAFLAVCVGVLLVRAVQAEVAITAVHAELSATQPHQVEVYFELRNATAHELELLKVVCDRAERVEFKQRSVGADSKARLWPVAKFEVPAGESLKLHADGRFFLLSGLDAGVSVGQGLALTLTFEDERPVTLQLRLEAARR